MILAAAKWYLKLFGFIVVCVGLLAMGLVLITRYSERRDIGQATYIVAGDVAKAFIEKMQSSGRFSGVDFLLDSHWSTAMTVIVFRGEVRDRETISEFESQFKEFCVLLGATDVCIETAPNRGFSFCLPLITAESRSVKGEFRVYVRLHLPGEHWSGKMLRSKLR